MSGTSPSYRGGGPVSGLLGSLALCITLSGAAGLGMHAQGVPSETPPSTDSALPNDAGYPVAEPVADPAATRVEIDALHQSRRDGHLLLDGNVHLSYAGTDVDADHIDYSERTGELEASGNLQVRSPALAEALHASRGVLNVRNNTGRFYDVSGSVGLRPGGFEPAYTVRNPFLFQGRIVVKNGPADYEIYDGAVTSCQMAQPDWQFAAAKFTVHRSRAAARGAVFRFHNLPVFYLPYATLSIPQDGVPRRQSGVLIALPHQSSTKGFILSEQIYIVLGRSADLTLGADYFSRRGWQQSATFRFKGHGLDFAHAHYSNLLDRGFLGTIQAQGPDNTIVSTTGYVNQGGEDILFSGRKDLGPHTRFAADAEYLSSYSYRQAFTENFNQAVVTDILSTAYGTTARNGVVGALEFDRFQALKRTLTGEQVRIFHLPSLDGDVLERHIGHSPFLWSATAQQSLMKRTQGSQVVSTQLDTGNVDRFELRPEVALPFGFAGFRFRPAAALRETFYSRQRAPVPLPSPQLPVTVNRSLNRTLFEADVDIRPPVLERTFETRGLWRTLLGSTVKHVIEPDVHYRYVTGVSQFVHTPRFDPRDVVSNTNELQYGITQRLFLKPAKLRACEEGELPIDNATVADRSVDQHQPDIAPVPDTTTLHTAARSRPGDLTLDAPTCGGTRETLRWRIAESYYADDSFGKNVLVENRRNVLETTLDLSGVAFLTNERNLSPVVSELKVSATDHLDVEWDMNYDVVLDKFTQSNIFANYHRGDYFSGLSYARLNAPGRFQKISGDTQTTSLLSDFSQIRLLAGYGSPLKKGFGLAGNVGLDLASPQSVAGTQQVFNKIQPQYIAVQSSYNSSCCGISVEYRKYELGSVRNENDFRFSISLANIGTAGTLRRAERLF